MNLTRLRVLIGRTRAAFRLESLRARLWRQPAGAIVTLDGMRLRITDGPNAYVQYKDEFVRRNYSFQSTSASPVVIDGGANMGMFALATLRDHPTARITAFEPDQQIFDILRENLAANGAGHVSLVNAAVGPMDGTMGFSADGQAGGALDAQGTSRVRVERLSRYLGEPVAFVKLNIEGAELDVLHEIADAGVIRNIGAMVVEYHGWPAGEQRLGRLLQLLGDNGFRYMIHDFDEQSNPRTKPPFAPPGDSPWFVLVYAWQPQLNPGPG